MLFPQEKRTPSEPAPAPAPAPAQAPLPQPIILQAPSAGVKIPILFGAVLALVGACIYLYYQVSQVRSELADTRDSLSAEISKLNETSTVSNLTSRHNLENLEKDLAKARAQAAQLSGQAKSEATAHADDIAARLTRAQEAQGKQIAGVSSEVSQVKNDTSAANTKIGQVSTEVATVRSDGAKTRSDLEKTIADLKSTRGDLGVQSGLIATNGKELSALRALGERNYTDFKISKVKHDVPQRVGDLQIVLKSADPKKNRYTIEVIADDKRVLKENKTINEPVQLLLSRSTLPYEVVVNDIKKNFISGYVSAPKVQQPRASK